MKTLIIDDERLAREELKSMLAKYDFLDIVDEALLRPGRFDRIIQVPNPDTKGRQHIFELLSFLLYIIFL